jgi:colicin import membrane protein
MTARSPSAFLLSTAVHAVAVGFAILFFLANQQVKEPPRVLELVAGEGLDYMAREAPAAAAEPVPFNLTPAPAEPRKVELAPAQPPPIAPAPPPQAVEQPVAPNWAQQIKTTVTRANTTAKKEIAKQKAAEQKQLAEQKRLQEKKEQEERKQLEDKKLAEQAKQKTITKEEFDRLNKTKTPPPKKAAPIKVAKIDAERLAREVLAGSAKSKAGAGGTALTATEASEVERYIALLLRRLKEELDQTPGVEDGLRAEAEFHILADGRLVRGTIVTTSGNEVFDRAVLRAITAVKMPPRPKGLGEVQKVPFSTHARN